MRQFDKNRPVFDNHCHICFPQPIDESLRDYEKQFQDYGIREAGLLSCPNTSHCENGLDILENLKTLYLKDRLSIPCFAYAGFTWHWDEAAPYAEFAQEMLDMGFDGFKSLDQHPRNRKDLGKGLADPSFKDFFDLANKNGNVMVCHVGDPRGSWDLSTASESAIRLGRVYADGFLSLDELYEEMESVIHTHRNMKFILAHFYFMSDNHDRLCRFLDENPHVYLDLTPGSEMYVNFSKDPAQWYDFFLRYCDRIILGSDHYALGHGALRYELARNFLEGTEPFDFYDKHILPVHLPEEVLEKIYWKNIHHLIGNTPKPVNREMAYAHCEYVLKHKNEQLTERNKANLETMMAFWK